MDELLIYCLHMFSMISKLCNLWERIQKHDKVVRDLPKLFLLPFRNTCIQYLKHKQFLLL